MIRALLALLLLAAPAFAQPKPATPPGGPPGTSPGAPAPPPAGERGLVLRNQSETTIREFYAWGTGERPPGPDRLGADVLLPGRDFPMRLGRGPCEVMLRAVFEDGGVETRTHNACTPREVVFDDRNTRPLDVVNDTDEDLMQLFLVRGGERGPDRLGRFTVAANDSLRVRLRGEAECVFEARAVFRGGREVAAGQVDICTTPRVALGDPTVPLREATVANRSQRVLRELYAAPPEREGWGGDRLGVNVLQPGQSFLLRIRTPGCQVRLRAVWQDGRSEERAGVEICAAQEIAFGAPRRVALTHAHARPVREVYLSAVEESDWGPDRLGGRPLAAGETREIAAETGCRADLRIVFDNGNAEEVRDVDICARAAFTLRPGWVAE
jgi:hypothetical protein